MSHKHVSRFSKLFFLLIAIALVQSCNKDSEPEVKDYQRVHDISMEAAKNIFGLMGQSQLGALVKYSIDVYTYKYDMVYKGVPIKASGLICVPASVGEFPVLSFQHGTITAHREAPTVDYESIPNQAIEAVAGMGYVVLIPDEIGFGASSDYFHPFLVKEPIVQSVRGMLNAVRTIPDGDLSGASMNDSLFLMGYSHGGWATMATLSDMEASAQTDWNLIATSCGAGPYHPQQVMNYALSLENYQKPYYLSFVMLSFLDADIISNSLSDFYNEPYASKIPDLYNGINTGSQIDAQLSTNLATLFAPNFLNNYQGIEFLEIQQALSTNGTDAWLNETPLMLFHGQNDIYIPQTVSDSMYIDFMELGSQQVEYQVIPFADHGTAAIPTIGSTLIWFNSFK